ncbi:MAG: type IX secretion system sortase PorU [Crocinitomicaceae bacterium]|nr:type IX secretion system sortase PorU [Crocinitomicaceae bacterium]
MIKIMLTIREIKYVLIIMSFFFAGYIGAQEIWKEQIVWGKSIEAKGQNGLGMIPQIEGQGYQFNRIQFEAMKELKAGFDYQLSLKRYAKEGATSQDLAYLTREGIEVPTQLDLVLDVKNQGKQRFGVLILFPFVRENGSVYRIVDLEVEVKELKKQVNIPAKNFAANSVLKSGSFYKLEITKDGLYKIDKAFLDACGFNTTNLASSTIHIFGNGEGMMDENNATPRTDDLASNALYMVDGGDGTFDEGDYLLFYGKGPHRWVANGTANFVRKTNVYSDYSYYFIHISSQIPSNTVQLQGQSSLAVNSLVTTSSERLHYEKDQRNLVSGGQRWYGEIFDTELSQNFGFTVSNIQPNSQASIRFAVASNSTNASNNIKISNGSTVLYNDNLYFSGSDYTRMESLVNQTVNSGNFNINVTIQRSNPAIVTFLDFLTINAEQQLKMIGNEYAFRSLKSVGAGKVSRFVLQNTDASVQIWDVTDKQNPIKIDATYSNGQHEFILETDNLREFIAFKGSSFSAPVKKGFIQIQNLHALEQVDLVIVSPAAFLSQATRLAGLHRSEGLTVHVVTPEQIFNEFSSGMQDPVAIRQFMRMFYQRGLANGTKLPKHLLLFGDGIYDPKQRVSASNYVMTYQVLNSEDHIRALVSDDFFGFLDDNEGFNDSDLLDIGVGRLLISDNTIAKQQVDKIEHYIKNGSSFYTDPGVCDCPVANTRSTYGDWRTKYVQIADDEESGYFILQDTEPQDAIAKAKRKEMNVDKIYLDAYKQISNAGGQRYPDVVDAINDRIRRGALVVNYVGHGGEVGVAEERVITVPQIQAWKNSNALNLMVSATCEFTKFDDPSRISAGEWVSLNPEGGSIALMTTTRSVYFSVNTQTGKSFFQHVFERDNDSLPLTFGEIIQRTKNGLGSVQDNKRSFTLIGDPALRIAMPRLKMVLDSVYRDGSSAQMDTIRALDKITIVGHMEDQFGNLLNDFNGVASPTVYDKPKTFNTLGQDAQSPVIPFELQKNALYKGKASIVNGTFSMTFIVPKDIDYSFGKGKISLYGNNSTSDAMGVNEEVVIGGSNPNGIADNVGPQIDLYLNDKNFVDGGITNETPIFLADVFDDNGINAVGNGIGHDITLIIDGKTDEPYVLNDYYVAGLDNYQRGSIQFSMPTIEPGEHTLTFKIWDVNNNSSEASLKFVVKAKEKPELDHVLNYPNPFTTKTDFFFEHNQVNTVLETQIQIFTVSGKLVKTINETVNTSGFRSNGIPWDGKDDFGDQLAKGVYVYRLSIRTDEGDMAEKMEKLVILK